MKPQELKDSLQIDKRHKATNILMVKLKNNKFFGRKFETKSKKIKTYPNTKFFPIFNGRNNYKVNNKFDAKKQSKNFDK